MPILGWVLLGIGAAGGLVGAVWRIWERDRLGSGFFMMLGAFCAFMMIWEAVSPLLPPPM